MMEKSRRVRSAAFNTLKNKGKNLSRKHLELSERREAFAWKKRRGKRAVRKAPRIKHETARARSRLNDLKFSTFNVRIAAVNGANGIGHIETLLRPCAPKGCDVIGLQEILDCRRYWIAGDKTGRNFRNGGIWIPCLFQR